MKPAQTSEAHDSAVTAVQVSRRTVITGMAALAPWLMSGRSVFAAEELRGDELPLHTTGLEHIGMVVPDVTDAARFYSSVFNPQLQKEKGDPLRYYVMTGTGYIALGSRANVKQAKIDHYCTLVRVYDRDRMNAVLTARGMAPAARGVVPDPDGIGLQLIAVPGGPGPTAVPGGQLVDVLPLVQPIGFDSIELLVADLHRSAGFYRQFYGPAVKSARDRQAFRAADTQIVLRTVPVGESPGVGGFAMRVATFDRAKVASALAALGATSIEKARGGALGFRDPNGIRVDLMPVRRSRP